MAELTLGVFPSLVGSMTLDFSFKLAEAALRKALLELKAARRHHGSNPLPSAA